LPPPRVAVSKVASTYSKSMLREQQVKQRRRAIALGAGGPEVAPTTFFGRGFGGVGVGLSTEGDSELIDRLGDRGLRRLLHERNAVVANLDHHAIIVRYLPKDFTADRFLGLLEADLSGVVANTIYDNLHTFVE